MRLAVLDVGSNTVHLVVVDGRADGTFTVVARERKTLRLAEAAFPSMSLPAQAVGLLVASVARMRAVADDLRAGAITGFATSAIREARNGLDVLDRSAGRRAARAGREPPPGGDPALAPIRALRPGPARGAGRPAGARPGAARPAGRPDQGGAVGGDLRDLQDLPEPRHGRPGAARCPDPGATRAASSASTCEPATPRTSGPPVRTPTCSSPSSAAAWVPVATEVA